MKSIRKAIFLFLTVAAILTACDETSETKTSVGYDFTATGTGVLVCPVESGIDKLVLSGSIDILYGHFNVLLENPYGDTLWTKTYTAVTKDKIDSVYTPIPGYWYLRYSIERADNGDAPEGSFSFSLTYQQ